MKRGLGYNRNIGFKELFENANLEMLKKEYPVSFDTLNHLLPAAKRLKKVTFGAVGMELDKIIVHSENKKSERITILSGLKNNIQVYNHSFLNQ